MKFKHSFNVFVDNFGTIYKVLLYRVIVLLFSLCLYAAVIFPFLTNISGTTEFTELSSLLGSFGTAFVNLDFAAMQTYWLEIREAFVRLMEMLGSMTGSIVLTVAIVILVYLVQKFLLGLSNYTAAAMVNDKMAMHAASPFIGTLIKNLGKACLYNAIYVPLSTLYNIIAIAIIFGISAGLMAMGTPILLLIFLASTAMVFLIAIQMTFTSDWLPSLIYAKTTNRGAMVYSFNYISAGNKKFSETLSHYVVFVLIIFAMNVVAVFFTLGAGLFITLPASYVLFICFQFVNYCDNNEIKYFVDKNTIIKPDRETIMTREQFFKGDNQR